MFGSLVTKYRGNNKYIVKEDSTNYKFISKQRVNKRKNVAPTIQSDENESEDLNKSLVATVATVAVVAFIFIFRRVMKQLNTQEIDTYIVEYVNESRDENQESK